MFELIKPGTNYDFMGRRKVFFALSGGIVAASLVAVLVLGLNQGIDFKGGTKVIVSFQSEAHVDRDGIRSAVEEMVSKETGVAGTQVEVQDFDLTSDTAEGELPTRKYQLYTELTSLLTDERKGKIAEAIQAKFGEGTRVETPEEGGDVFYIGFEQEAAIPDRTAALAEVFAAAPFNYAQVNVVSDKEREIEVDFIRELNLVASESEAAEGGGQTPQNMTQKSFDDRKAQMLAELKDARYTVAIQELQNKLSSTLRERFPKEFVDVESSTVVSASVGSDLLANGLLAILYAIIGMLIYIALRFDIRYAPGAVAALVHDVTITIGIFSILQIKFTLPIIAALLTIVGYSLNDTIVVFDRIRENVEKLRGRAFESVINRSVNETLSRTILTSATTLIVVVSVLVLGGGLIQDFAFALLIGILVGTYSSIFIASPVALYLDRYLAARAAERKATR